MNSQILPYLTIPLLLNNQKMEINIFIHTFKIYIYLFICFVCWGYMVHIHAQVRGQRYRVNSLPLQFESQESNPGLQVCWQGPSPAAPSLHPPFIFFLSCDKFLGMSFQKIRVIVLKVSHQSWPNGCLKDYINYNLHHRRESTCFHRAWLPWSLGYVSIYQ